MGGRTRNVRQTPTGARAQDGRHREGGGGQERGGDQVNHR